MIHNFPELVAIVDLHYRKIRAIRTAIKYAEWRFDFKKVSELRAKEQWIRKKILRYIDFYKTQMTGKYLENQIYGNQLAELENFFQKIFQDYSCDLL